MLYAIKRATFVFAQHKAGQSAAWAVFARDTVSRFVKTAHHALMILGLIAIAALGIMFVKPDIADHIKAISPFAVEETEEQAAAPLSLSNLIDAPAKSGEQDATTKSVSLSEEERKAAGTPRQQQWVTSWLSKRYRVAGAATNMLVSATYLTAQEIKLDPLLILAVMAIESGFNPFAESPVGAQGLMQVMSKVHHEKFEDLGGVKAALNPVANIKVGALILKDYVTRGGSVEAGLKLYVGAAAFDSDYGYGARVLAEYRRLKEVATGKHVPIVSTTASSTSQKTRQPDASNEHKQNAPTDAESAQVNLPVIKTNQVAAL